MTARSRTGWIDNLKWHCEPQSTFIFERGTRRELQDSCCVKHDTQRQIPSWRHIALLIICSLPRVSVFWRAHTLTSLPYFDISLSYMHIFSPRFPLLIYSLWRRDSACKRFSGVLNEHTVLLWATFKRQTSKSVRSTVRWSASQGNTEHDYVSTSPFPLQSLLDNWNAERYRCVGSHIKVPAAGAVFTVEEKAS